jgi:2-polyprenyl-6-methoxyphenol hydroxylase-like FAD-dependent oxidoreductase
MRLNREVWADQLTELFAGDLPLIRDLIRRTPEIHAYPIHDLPHVPRWRDGRVVLIGDAAHATSPSSGQGASLALEDAAFLAVCLRDIADPSGSLPASRSSAARVLSRSWPRAAVAGPTRRRAAAANVAARCPHAHRFPLFVTERSLAWIHDYRVPRSAA